VRSDRVTLIIISKMDPEGIVPEVMPKPVLNQTDISTGIGPTGTDTPAPKDIMPHADHLEHSVEEPLSRPPGALFQVGSGSKGDMNEKIPEPISAGEEQPETNGTVAKSQKK